LWEKRGAPCGAGLVYLRGGAAGSTGGVVGGLEVDVQQHQPVVLGLRWCCRICKPDGSAFSTC